LVKLGAPKPKALHVVNNMLAPTLAEDSDWYALLDSVDTFVQQARRLCE
jgi:hypothetical protein